VNFSHQSPLFFPTLARLKNEMTFYYKLTLAINLAFLPEKSDVAFKAVDYLKDEGTDLVQERLKVEKHVIIACKSDISCQIPVDSTDKRILILMILQPAQSV
jgi:hypothetical protein